MPADITSLEPPETPRRPAPLGSTGAPARRPGSSTAGVAWTLAGAVAMKGGYGLSSLLVARVLGPTLFGELSLVQSTVSMFAAYCDFKLGNTAVKYVSEHRARNPARAAAALRLALWTALLLCGVVSLAFAWAAPRLANGGFQRPDLVALLSLGALLVFLNPLAEIIKQALGGFRDFRGMALVNSFRGFLTVALCVPAAWMLGVPGVLVAGAAISALVLWPTWRMIRRNARDAGLPRQVPFSRVWAEWRMLLHFSMPAFLGLAILSAAAWGTRVVLSRQGGGFQGLGIFEAGYQWTTLVLFLPTVLQRVAFPVLSELHGAGSEARFKAVCLLQLQTVTLLATPVALLLMVGRDLVPLAYGSAYHGLGQILPALAVAGFLRALNESLMTVLASLGRQWRSCALYAAWAAVFVALAVLLIPAYGFLGLAWASLLAEGVLWVAISESIGRHALPGHFGELWRLVGPSAGILGGGFLAVSLLSGNAAIAVLGALLIWTTRAAVRHTVKLLRERGVQLPFGLV